MHHVLFVYVPPSCPSPQDASLGGELLSGAADAVDKMEDQSSAHVGMDMKENHLWYGRPRLHIFKAN